MTLTRSCGVLLHPTSLPGPYGIGDLGPEAFRYVDWLASAGASWWQVLPTNPTSQGDSPYSATSTFAGNPLLISPDRLLEDGLLTDADLVRVPDFPDHTVDYEGVRPFKDSLLRRAFERFRSAPPAHLADELDTFRSAERAWLDDYALFAALAAASGTSSWRRWPAPLAGRELDVLSGWRDRHAAEIDFEVFCQFLFFRQWRALHAYAHRRGVRLFGDLPIFVALDSADVWAHRDLFRLDDDGAPTLVAGVPPDYFSVTGQRWGNPVYDWPRHRRDGYRWWAARLRHALSTVDLLRLDHFRGFVASWQIPTSEPTAVKGRWMPGPGERFFAAMRDQLGALPLVAEDLGFITRDVVQLKEKLRLPGMAVLQFAFAPGKSSTFLPHNHVRDLVVYTGTHDNDTTLGWWMGAADDGVRTFLRRYLGTNAGEIHWDLIRAALASVAVLAVVPHQDLAGLGTDCRMNTPGVAEGNWRFRITRWMLDDGIRQRFADLIRLYDR
jgi:4-alpha-glucanotransferase